MFAGITPPLLGGARKRPLTQQLVYLTAVGAANWTVPDDWTDDKNTIECIGGGSGSYGGGPAGGGGGGAYAKKSNVALIPRQVCLVNIGNGGAWQSVGGDSWLKNQAGTVLCLAQGGGGTNPGFASNCVGDVRLDGGTGGSNSGGYNGGGAGGAAGPSSAGGPGGAGATGVVGGSGGGAGGVYNGGYSATASGAGAGGGPGAGAGGIDDGTQAGADGKDAVTGGG